MHRLKSFLLLVGFAVLLLNALALTSCSFLNMPDDRLRHLRVKQLMLDLSSSAADRHIIDNFHSAMTSRSAYASESHWAGTEFDKNYRPFESNYSPAETDLGGGVFRLTTSFNNRFVFPPGSWTHYAIVFELKEDGPGNWMIIYLSGAGVTCGTP